MKTRIEQLWDEIAIGEKARLTTESAYVLRRIDPASTSNVFAGVDGAGRVMLAIGVMSVPPALSLKSDSIDYFRQKRTDGSWLMALRLSDVDLLAVFGRLCHDLIESLRKVTNESDVVALVEERLDLWRRLFDNGIPGLLAPSIVKGLLAELLVLEELLTEGTRRPQEIVTAWLGPTGSDQDFQFADSAIEVKAVGLGAEAVSISSLQQLDAVVPTDLMVLTLRDSSPNEAGSVGLNQVVRSIEGRLSPFPSALTLFRDRLEDASYAENSYYDSKTFQVLSMETFPVTPTLPKLTRNSVPQGVHSATYMLSLNSLRATNGNGHG